MQLQVTNSPFNQEQVELLNRLLPTLTESQQIWLTGYLFARQNAAGATTALAEVQAISAASTASEAVTIVNQSAASKEVTILFGSQTGNCQRLATGLGRKLEEQGLQVTIAAMNKFKTNNLKKSKTCC